MTKTTAIVLIAALLAAVSLCAGDLYACGEGIRPFLFKDKASEKFDKTMDDAVYKLDELGAVLIEGNAKKADQKIKEFIAVWLDVYTLYSRKSQKPFITDDEWLKKIEKVSYMLKQTYYKIRNDDLGAAYTELQASTPLFASFLTDKSVDSIEYKTMYLEFTITELNALVKDPGKNIKRIKEKIVELRGKIDFLVNVDLSRFNASDIKIINEKESALREPLLNMARSALAGKSKDLGDNLAGISKRYEELKTQMNSWVKEGKLY